MDDQRMLELAAKACEFGTPNKVTGRLQHCWTESEYPKRSGKVGALLGYKGWGDDAELWNPLTDDGDARRSTGDAQSEMHG